MKNKNTLAPVPNRWFYLLALLLTSQRFFHLFGMIDEPHAWRQCDTANYIREFYLNGIDLFYPAVCWMGGYKTLILEFPLPEAVVALIYHIGGEHLILARLTFLTFFLGSAYLLFKILSLLLDRYVAQLAILIFLSIPLSLFYSRAVHIDFVATFFVFGMTWFLIKAIHENRLMYLLSGILLSVPAFLIKAPYAFFMVLPLVCYALKERKFIWILKRSPLVFLPVLLFFLWQKHVYLVNGAAPDWDYILHYRKFNDNSHWYFGNMAQRLDWINWKILSSRFLFEVSGIPGIIFFLIGIAISTKRKTQIIFWAWLAGAGLSVFIFFNLNVIHNYYQIPLLAPVAVFIALGVNYTSDLVFPVNEKLRFKFTLVLLFLIFGSNIFIAEKIYYQTEIQSDYSEIGKIINENTSDEDLVIVNYKNMDCRNPQILFRAERNGWSLENSALNPLALEKLWLEENANWLITLNRQEVLAARIHNIKMDLKGTYQLRTSSDSLFLYALH